MRPPRLDHHGVDDHAGNDRPVGVGANHGLVDQLLADHDHALGREGRFLLYAKEPPHLRIAIGVRALHVHDRDAGVERGYGGKFLAGERARHRANARIHARQVRAHVIAQRPEGEFCRARRKARDHAEVRVLLELERRPSPLGGPPKGVQRTGAGVPGPAEHQLPRAARRDHLIVDHVGRQSAERQLTPLLSYDFVPRRKTDQVRKPLDDDRVAVVHVRRDRVVHRDDFRHRPFRQSSASRSESSNSRNPVATS